LEAAVEWGMRGGRCRWFRRVVAFVGDGGKVEWGWYRCIFGVGVLRSAVCSIRVDVRISVPGAKFVGLLVRCGRKGVIGQSEGLDLVR
jgi:hypothetical protein